MPLCRRQDRTTFVRTLGEACERAGFRVTPHFDEQPVSLAAGDEGTEPFPRNGLAAERFYSADQYPAQALGISFGGRYKAILVEPGNCFWALLDYIHLNPVRAGLVQAADGLESYPWSSLRHYIAVPKMRPRWLETAMAFSVTGCENTASGRRKFLETLELRVDWKNPRQAGAVYSKGEGKPELALHSALRRGWFFGSQEFREMLLYSTRFRPVFVQSKAYTNTCSNPVRVATDLESRILFKINRASTDDSPLLIESAV